MNIVCFHLYNDFSGSPKVLRNVIEGLHSKGHQIRVVTSNTNGALNDLNIDDNLKYDYYHYHPYKNRILWAIAFVWAQFRIFFKAFKYYDSSVFYINTIMPFGAAIAGKLLHKRIIYHYHENAFIKGAFYRSLYRIMLLMADDIICVSNYQRSFLQNKKRIYVVHNALPKSFTDNIKPDPIQSFERKNVLMVSSLIIYKGVIEFIRLAQQLKEFNFTLVLNESDASIENFKKQYNITIPKNLTVYSRQSNVCKFYNDASIVLNLTNSKVVIETFGMTALESMTAGVPVIVPTKGGIADLVIDGVNGYKIDVQELLLIASKINMILHNQDLYYKLSEGALKTASKFSYDNMCNAINNIIMNKH